jgi:hypothetical protein
MVPVAASHATPDGELRCVDVAAEPNTSPEYEQEPATPATI